MSRIDTIRSELLTHRTELEADLAAVNTALAALGGKQEKVKGGEPSKSKTQRAKPIKRKQSPPSQKAMETTFEALQGLEEPIRTTDLAKLTGLSQSLTSKTAGYLYREGRIRGPEGPDGLGYVKGQKGKIPLWAKLTVTENGSDQTGKSEPEAPAEQTEQQQQELPVA